MSIFELPQQLESVTGGSTRFDCTEMYPISGNITQSAGTYIGSGSASGNSIFQFKDSAQWWSPSMSYFRMQLKLTKQSADNTEGSLSPTDYVALADNFVSTLFTKITTQINSRNLDTIDNVAVMDTALHYANCKSNFLKTFGSLTWLGQPFTTRLQNSCDSSGPTTIEVVFRPPISIFECKLLPPGAQFTFTFNWAPSAANAFESLCGNVNVGKLDKNFNLRVESFSFFKATVTPSPMIKLPEQAVLDLAPAVVNQYYLNNSNALKQNITIPSTTNRILVVMQDTSTDSYQPGFLSQSVQAGIGAGFNPSTSFSLTAYGGGSPAYPNVAINSMWLSLPELGINAPNPVYNFSDLKDLMRAYSDFCHVTQGTSLGWEGSIPYGNLRQKQGVPIRWLATTTSTDSVFNLGNPNNDQAPIVAGKGTSNTFSVSLSTTATTVTVQGSDTNAPTFYQASKYGWVGARPGPIFAFPVVRPEGKSVSTGTLNVTFSSYNDLGTPSTQMSPKSVAFSVISSYSMALQLTNTGTGEYIYEIVEGI